MSVSELGHVIGRREATFGIVTRSSCDASPDLSGGQERKARMRRDASESGEVIGCRPADHLRRTLKCSSSCKSGNAKFPGRRNLGGIHLVWGWSCLGSPVISWAALWLGPALVVRSFSCVRPGQHHLAGLTAHFRREDQPIWLPDCRFDQKPQVSLPSKRHGPSVSIAWR